MVSRMATKQNCGNPQMKTPISQIRLKANPGWPGRPAPAFENIQIRFFEDAGTLLRSMVEFQAIDVAC